MAKRIEWQDEYWLLLIQLYLQKPEGVKHLFSRGLVDIALELHIPPKDLHTRMYRLRQIDTPRLQRLWDEYAGNPRKLRRGVKLLRQMNGFGNADAFYAGVGINESWERDFKPIGGTPFSPMMLTIVLDLYFRLTPVTMAVETPEVVELARLMHVTPGDIVGILDIFMACDPYMRHAKAVSSPLTAHCQELWAQYGNDDPEKLAALAAQMKEYFK